MAAATAPPCAAQVPDEREDRATVCRQVVGGLMTALEVGDADALRVLIYADRRVGAQQLGLNALIDCIVAQRALEQAMVRRWGAAAAVGAPAQALFSPADRAALQDARVEVYDNGALVILSSGVSPIVLRHSRFDGRWRVVVRALSSLYDGFERNPEPGSLKRIGYLRAVAGALRRVTAQVADGKVRSPDAARAALQKTLEAAIKAAPQELPPDTGNRNR